jgi:hypothetical protein
MLEKIAYGKESARAVDFPKGSVIVSVKEFIDKLSEVDVIYCFGERKESIVRVFNNVTNIVAHGSRYGYFNFSPISSSQSAF